MSLRKNTQKIRVGVAIVSWYVVQVENFSSVLREVPFQ
jgi:hypothetical protein